MITGSVIHRRPTVPLVIDGLSGRAMNTEAVLDTGFNGFLTLPPAAVAALALSFLNYFNAALANGSRVRMQVHTATILWDGAERDIEILATGREALLGTSLLDGHDVHIQFADSGLITIEPL